MVGGNRNSSQYVESIQDYAQSEGGIDYNAGLVGALAYIVSKNAPADTSKFGLPVQIPTTISIFQNNTGELPDLPDTVQSISAPLYALVYDQDGKLMDANCELMSWVMNKNSTNFTHTGCDFDPVMLPSVEITDITATYVFPGADRPQISRTIFASNVSVRHVSSLARNGYAISVRPGNVLFTAADGLTISKIGIYNMQGRQIFKYSGTHREVSWRSSRYPRGMYLIRMTMSSGAVVQRNLLLK
jgi:hypothetical protein